MKNQLFYGDNLEILRKSIENESVDLCYIDPPFNSQRKYNQIYNNIGSEDTALAQAFIDTWTWDEAAEYGMIEIIENIDNKYSGRLIELVCAFERVLGKGSLLAYIISMALRVQEIHRVLKKTGSFYLHCDPTAGHYLKILCDSIFIENGGEFQNEIIWRRTGSHNKNKRFSPIHDVIYFYTKSEKYKWNNLKRPYMLGHVNENFEKKDKVYKTKYYGNVLTGSGIRGGESGKPWKGIDPTSKGRHWAIPKALREDIIELIDSEINFDSLSQHQKLDLLFEYGFIKFHEGQFWPIYEREINDNDGQPMSDLWTYQPYTEGTVFRTKDGIDKDVKWLSPKDKERLGYPTQKPEGLLERIIKSSSNSGDVVLDAYCGCGTTISVAERLQRKWIGIDITYQSISVIVERLKDNYGENIIEEFSLNGIPKDFDSAVALANKNDDRIRKEFEKWVILTFTNNKAIINEKKGSDKGIDGKVKIVHARKDNKDEIKDVLFSVKSGQNIGVKDIRDFRGVIERENAAFGVFISLYDTKTTMLKEALQAGKYENGVFDYLVDRIQIVTVTEIISGKRLHAPFAIDVLKRASEKNNMNQLAFRYHNEENK
jgi:DNA modification methylase